MCSVALSLTDNARAITETRHIILTPLNVKICVEAKKQSAPEISEWGNPRRDYLPTHGEYIAMW